MTPENTTSAHTPRRSGRRVLRPLLLIAAAVAWVLVVHASSWRKSAAADEIPHLGAGLTILDRGDFRMNPEHPPLMKVLSALPVYLFYRPDLTVEQGNHVRASWVWSLQIEHGYRILHLGGRDPLIVLALARVVPTFVGLLGGVLAWKWGRELSRRRAGGALAAAFLLLYPEYAGHARLLTFDVPTLVGCAAVSWFGLQWWKRPDLSATARLALVFALASQIKLPVVVYSGFLLATMFALALFRPRPERLPRAGRVIALAAALALTWTIALWAAYGFRFLHHPPGEPPETPASYIPRAGASATGIRQRLVQFAWEKRLLPEAALAVVNHIGSFEGRRMYLFGEESRKGWYWYFPATIALKTPLVLLAGIAAAVITAAWKLFPLKAPPRRRRLRERFALLGMPFLLLFGIYVLSRPNIGHRQILFIYFPGCVVLGWAGAQWLATGTRAGRTAVGGMLACLVLVFLLAFPHYETYMNELVRTPYRGSRYLGDSNIDWGTDLPLAAAELKKLGLSNRPVNYAAFGANRPESYRLTHYRWILPHYPFAVGMPPAAGLDPRLPTLVSLQVLEDLRFMYPGLFDRDPDHEFNSMVLFMPGAPPRS